MTAEEKKEYMRRWREKNKERLTAANKVSCLERYYRNHEANKAKKREDYERRKEIIKLQRVALRIADPEKHRKIKRDSARRHRERASVQQREWRQRNKERQREYKRLQYMKNSGIVKARAMEYAKSHPGYRAAIARKRQAIRKGCPVEDIRAVAAFYRTVRTTTTIFCHWCKKAIPRGRERTVDHVIPLALSGRHAIDNLVPACRSCNCSKNKKHPDEYVAIKAQRELRLKSCR